MVPFYVPETPAYTIVQSAADSLRFTMTCCLTNYLGATCATSSFVKPDGSIMDWHDFGPLEGPGWAANAVGGAYEMLWWARFMGDAKMEATAISILKHVLGNGFVDYSTGMIRGYRHTLRDEFVLNFKSNNDWFCPGSTAKIAVQMLLCSDLLPEYRHWLESVALNYARWMDRHLELLPNGWFPRRVTPEGKHYTKAAEGGNDKFFATSADGLFILQLWAELTDRGLADYREPLRKGLQVFMDAGGIYGSINHDTYDPQESVAYSVAFRVFRRAGQVLDDPALGQYALEQILPGLDRFKMHEDRNGVATKGLLYMEDSWDTSYMWENAEAALAHLEAYTDTGNMEYLVHGLTILRAISKHHHGPHGFLTEGVDWNNHVSQQHHVDQALYGDIQYTEPFLNNQHIVEPTLYYLENHAKVVQEGKTRKYYDYEGNLLVEVK
ncbi:MAG TPA: hypothetical protein PLQ89_14815 [Phycisphaerae bacterium]|nr:hypothetical protein [Phycisphaerae bacterium]HOQ86982.1 hypothetical protein [Phycisphaerae bacterium]HPP26608.1 hypothetical protein [Phycisphaerae bacterium]HPU25049.1 hypothetical protein [Phycisphaerae bacterium]HQA00330.1 hypothetical protein [Phycisphaerae bacterium]